MTSHLCSIRVGNISDIKHVKCSYSSWDVQTPSFQLQGIVCLEYFATLEDKSCIKSIFLERNSTEKILLAPKCTLGRSKCCEVM